MLLAVPVDPLVPLAPLASSPVGKACMRSVWLSTDDRPASVWDFLKEFRNIQIFNKRPRKPEISVFDNMPGIKGADDMIRKPRAQDEEEIEQPKKKPRRENPKTDDDSNSGTEVEGN